MEDGIVVFVFHDVADSPSEHSQQVGDNVGSALFRRQLDWIRKSFDLADPRDMEEFGGRAGTAVITFDDGYRSFVTTALPILEEYQVPVVLFLNMDVVQGAENSSAVVHWGNRNVPAPQRDWSTSVPNRFQELVDQIRGSGQHREYLRFQGDYLTESDLSLMDDHPLVSLGNHLSNHWYGPGLTCQEFTSSLEGNRQQLAEYNDLLPWLAFPHGIAPDRLNAHARELGVTRIFAGGGVVNADPDAPVLYRIDMNEKIANQMAFRWNLSARTTLGLVRNTSEDPMECTHA